MAEFVKVQMIYAIKEHKSNIPEGLEKFWARRIECLKLFQDVCQSD